SRDELYLTAMSRLSDELIRRLGAVDPGPPSALLAARVGIFFDFLDEFGDGYENMLGLGGPGTPAAILEIGRSARVKVCEVTYRALRIDDPPQVLRTAVQAWVAGVEWAGLDWFRTRGCPRAEVEQLMCIQFLMMLIGVGALDPVVANRVEWLTGVEPTDGSFAWFLHMAAARYSIRTAANLTRLLAAGDS
ncbi:MAG: TetR/AcrR family transcriptional regulator, partial [Streptosporangiaceae bacterium]